jgi:hypothetical protein
VEQHELAGGQLDIPRRTGSRWKQLVNSIKAVRISEKWSTRMDEARLEGNYSLSLS